MDERVLWTLNMLSSGQKQPRGIDRPIQFDHDWKHHVEALEEAGYVTARINRDGSWHVFVLKEGHDAAEQFRRDQVSAYTQPKAKA